MVNVDGGFVCHTCPVSGPEVVGLCPDTGSVNVNVVAEAEANKACCPFNHVAFVSPVKETVSPAAKFPPVMVNVTVDPAFSIIVVKVALWCGVETTFCIAHVSTAEVPDNKKYVPDKYCIGLEFAVVSVAAVVFAHVHIVGEVWLNVVVNAALDSVRFPAAFPIWSHVTVPLGMSPAPIALNVGVAAPPLVGPAKTVFAAALLKENDNAGVVVAVATDRGEQWAKGSSTKRGYGS